MQATRLPGYAPIYLRDQAERLRAWAAAMASASGLARSMPASRIGLCRACCAVHQRVLRPDGAKASYVPLLEAVVRITSRNPDTGRLKFMLRPVYVSPTLTKHTGVTMGFLRFGRMVFAALKVQHIRAELLAMYRLTRIGGFVEGVGVQPRAQPPPEPRPLLPATPVSPLSLF